MRRIRRQGEEAVGGKAASGVSEATNVGLIWCGGWVGGRKEGGKI